MKTRLLAACAALTLSALANAAQATTPLSGTLNVVANSNISGVITTDLNTGSWAAVPTTLAESATATAMNGADFITTSGSASATWSSADLGTVTFSNYGWDFSVGSSATTEAASDLTQGRGGDDWTYTFTPTQDGAISQTYDVSLVSGSGFGLWGWSINWSGPGGNLPVSDPSDPTASGVFTRPLMAGQTYTIGLNGNPNLSTDGPIDLSGAMDGSYAWQITSSVPEPTGWTLMLAGFGLVGAAHRRRRGHASATI